jgi:hypothetical protein
VSVVRLVIALLITSEAILRVSEVAILINVGSIPLFTSHNPVAVEKRKKTNVSNIT